MNEAERRAASEKYYQKLRAELDERIRSDKQLQKIAEKIANKSADFTDTAKYSEIVSNYIGAVLQENVGEITSPLAKEYVCKELLKDQHSAINELFESVQISIDEQNGIHIKTQLPKFPEERVDKVAHALEDPTVPLKTIKRRANAPVANVSKSFHDDCVKKNAQFRHDAGLKCYIVRIGTKCCEWCSEVAGKYEFGDQPDGIFRRHDNCDCTIIYDGQVLRGKYNSDGTTRGKTWAERGEVPAEYNPLVLTQEEAKEIERRNLAQIRGLKINNSSIDNSSGNGIIESERRISIRNVDTHGLRNESPLTQTQISQVKNYAVKLGMPPDQIRYGEHYYTAYGSTFDMLYIGTDVYPSENPVRANSRLSWKCAIAHEIVGHRETCLKGWDQSNLLYDEIQASIRAARFAPDLSQTERINLLRDACERANKNGLRLKDVRHKLHIDVR
ncbi:MAG: hypothetical protein K6G82_01320 [Ruminococcus sp.]|nr:hypothetical protein [Ruminococcus sp.]